MARIVRVGAGASEVTWKDAMLDFQADDVILLEPGFYQMRTDISLLDLTIKGTGANPEDTVIFGGFDIDEQSRFVNLENLCIKTGANQNSIAVSPVADTFVTLRNVTIKAASADATAIAINGQCTLELYSTKIIGSSVSFFKNSNFRLEMNDSLIDFYSTQYCALAFEGQGTAIINNSTIHGSLNSFASSNCELNVNNSQASFMIIDGQSWLNLLNTQITDLGEATLQLSGECWANIVNLKAPGGLLVDENARLLVQGSEIGFFSALNNAKITITSSIFARHFDLQDAVVCEATRSTFNGSGEFQYFFALSDNAEFTGHNVLLNPNASVMALKENATLTANVLPGNTEQLKVECEQAQNLKLLGMQWVKVKP